MLSSIHLMATYTSVHIIYNPNSTGPSHDYAKELQKGNGRLYLAGINPAVRDEIVRTAKLDLSGPVQLYEMTPLVGEATRKAVADAKAWLASQR